MSNVPNLNTVGSATVWHQPRGSQTAQQLAESAAKVIQSKGFVALPGSQIKDALQREVDSLDWPNFAANWNSLVLDGYMSDGGRYRRRRYASFRAPRNDAIRLNDRRPHFQKLDHNPLNGGIERWFEPFELQVFTSPIWKSLLNFARMTFDTCDPVAATWTIEAHQFRVSTEPGKTGLPTPEGAHRDGVDYVFMMLIDRQNVAGGMTCLTSETGERLAHLDLLQQGDAVLLHDTSIRHSVSAILIQENSIPAFRDMLVLTFVRR
jgi:hypothetical protein